ncbi:Uncharacterized protein HZ326_26479 [Fusarium oxysporum f. sp. albedinis]|nr:Uncharacterized protein HZ326_26479 [Fusarium oxysporum f. sp. albedinis]
MPVRSCTSTAASLRRSLDGEVAFRLVQRSRSDGWELCLRHGIRSCCSSRCSFRHLQQFMLITRRDPLHCDGVSPLPQCVHGIVDASNVLLT